MNLKKIVAACALAASAVGAHAVGVFSTADATVLAQNIAGTGITVVDATLATDATQGLFFGGAASVGFGTGVVLSNGNIETCTAGPNTVGGCGLADNGTFTSLVIKFTANTNNIVFDFVFGSDEYTSAVGGRTNDSFELLLDGQNIALVPQTQTAVSINTVNCSTNSQYYRNNPLLDANGDPINETNGCAPHQPGGIDIQFDGLTTVLQATGVLLGNIGQEHTLEFVVRDGGGSSSVDSAVFVREGSFVTTTPTTPPGGVPEPATTALLGLGLALAGVASRRSRRART